MKKKPKPATAGERLVTAWNDHHIGIDDVRDDPESRDLARRIDAAIRRAVRKERERCREWARNTPSVGVPGIDSGEYL